MCQLCVAFGRDLYKPRSGGEVDVTTVDGFHAAIAEVAPWPADANPDKGESEPSGDPVPTAQNPATDTVPGSISTPVTHSTDSYVRGYVNTAGDQDWYAVNLVAGQTYTFAMNGIGKSAIADTFLSLRNSSGVEVTSDDDSGPLAASKLTFSASSTGTYYIAAGGWEGGGSFGSATGQYLLTMNDGSSPYLPAISVNDVADYLTNTYWEVNASRAHKWGTPTVTFNCQGLEPERADLARLAFQTWADACNLTFTETFGAAQITLDDNDTSRAYANASWNGSGIISSAIINIPTTWFGGSDAVYSYTFQTFIHEIGHTLGLGHGGPYNGSATYGVDNSYANDSWQLSLMSYMDQVDASTGSFRFVMTPQIADIMAVQSVYGAATTRTNDTVYGFNATAGALFNFSTYTSAPAFTIYDSGGTDTLDCSGYSTTQTLDLTPGAFCNVGGFVGNIGIFTTTIIEAAVGGSGIDTILGNGAANSLRGRGGNDTIAGGAGTDSAIFAGSRSAYTLTDLGGGSVRVVGPDGTDTLSSVELLVFDDQTVAWPPIPNNQAPVITSDGGGDTAVLFRSEGGTAITTVSGTDPDGNPLTFAIVGGADAARFQINMTTGALSFIAPPNFEAPADSDGNNSYIVQIRASDGSLFDTQVVTINVGNVNEFAPVITSGGGGTAAAVSLPEMSSVVMTVAANDADFTGPSYYISGGLDAGKFVINATTGALMFITSPDFEVPTDSDANNSYVVQVDASDGAFFDTQEITVNIANIVNETLAPNDFNADLHSDILWRHQSGELNLFAMDGRTVVSTGPMRQAGSAYKVEDKNDFNGDGRADLLWRNTIDGTANIFLMDGRTIVNDGNIRQLNDSWQVQRTGDFDGDGNADILWRNTIDGTANIFLMDGRTIVNDGNIRPVNSDWQVQDVADFNGDGNSDILWRNTIDGTANVWMMDGRSIILDGNISTSLNNDWQVQETGDYDGDGKADILWRNTIDRTANIFHMDGLSVVSSGNITAHLDNTWQVV